MDYLKKKFKDNNDNIISMFSTDDNILCENGKYLRENINNITNSKKEERLAVTELATLVVPTGSNGAIDTNVSMGQLRQYKRFVAVQRGASNVGLPNTYFTFSTNQKGIARFNDGGFYGEFTLINKNLLECHAFSGNPSLAPTSVENGISYYMTTNRGRDLQNIYDIADTDTLKIYYSGTTTIDYAIYVYGLTKEVNI